MGTYYIQHLYIYLHLVHTHTNSIPFDMPCHAPYTIRFKWLNKEECLHSRALARMHTSLYSLALLGSVHMCDVSVYCSVYKSNFTYSSCQQQATSSTSSASQPAGNTVDCVVLRTLCFVMCVCLCVLCEMFDAIQSII